MMKKVMLVGDTHANVRWANNVCLAAEKAEVDLIIQLGDFGFVFEKDFLDEWAKAYCPVWFLRGNHDDTEWIKHRTPNNRLYGPEPVNVAKNLWYLPDGCSFTLGATSFRVLGGAYSIDRRYRTEYVSWWRDETLTQEGMFAAYEGGFVDVVLAHDAPQGIPALEKYLQSFDLPYKMDYDSLQSRKAHSFAMQGIEPSLYFHGHYHFPYEDKWVSEDGHVTIVKGLHMNNTSLRDNTYVLDLFMGSLSDDEGHEPAAESEWEITHSLRRH